jgi:nitronate monooxygenase
MGASMKNPLLTTLKVTHPIIQAPMAGVSTPALAAAVSNAGGLGSLGIGAATVDSARALIADTRTLTAKPFSVNLFCHQPATQNPDRESQWLSWLAPQFQKFNVAPPTSVREIYRSFVEDPDMLAMLLQERPAVVSFHFGLPPPTVIAALRSAGITLLATATNMDEAKTIVRADIDAIVAQGAEAGGHRGVFDPEAEDENLGVFALTRLLVRTADKPIIAAGGIMDGNGIAAALVLGAQAAQLGTAFVPCPESAIDDGYRQGLLKADVRTIFTTSISGRKARSLANDFTALERDPKRPPPPAYPIAYDAGKSLHAAAKAKGVHGFGAQWAGQAVRLSRVMPAAELMNTLETELKAAATALARQLS